MELDSEPVVFGLLRIDMTERTGLFQIRNGIRIDQARRINVIGLIITSLSNKQATNCFLP